MVTLINGTEVDSSSPQWLEECRQRHQHVANLRRLDRRMRTDYMLTLERKDGPEAARRVRAAFVEEWDRLRNAQESA